MQPVNEDRRLILPLRESRPCDSDTMKLREQRFHHKVFPVTVITLVRRPQRCAKAKLQSSKQPNRHVADSDWFLRKNRQSKPTADRSTV